MIQYRKILELAAEGISTRGIATSTELMVDYLLSHYQSERQALSAIFSLKNSERSYSKHDIERACKDVKSISLRPTVKMIQNQLKMNKKKETEAALKDQQKPSKNYGFTRGKDYWEGK